MNSRQKDILQILLKEQEKFLLVLDIAKKINYSEKTVRNDIKVIESYLEEHTEAKIIRKPGMGIYLDIEDNEKFSLFHQLYESTGLDKGQMDKDRMFRLAYNLLMNTEAMTIQELANRYFVNKAVIKKDLKELEKWFHQWNLSLVSRQRVGISVIGTERNKRIALANIEKNVKPFDSIGEFLKKTFPFHEVEIVKNELQQFQKNHSVFFTDDALERLLVHILFMMKRTKLKQYITTSEKERSLVTGKKEYQWTVGFLKKLEDYFVIRFPEEEIIYLAIHILSTKLRYPQNSESKDIYRDLQSQQFVEELVQRMSTYTKMDFISDATLLEGLYIHIHSAFHRIESGLVVANPMLSNIKKMYPYMFHSLIAVLENMEVALTQAIPEEEVAYLVLHFQAAVERLQKQRDAVKRVVIVCHLGVGMSQLLRIKLERKFHSFQILDCIAKIELKEYLSKHRVDFVISTVELDHVNVPYIIVSPLLEKNDEEKLTTFLKNNGEVTDDLESALVKYTAPSLLFLQMESMHRYELIEELGTTLYYQGYVEKEYIESVAARERAYSTTIGGGIAIPHGSPHLVKKSAIAIATFKEPMEWGTEKVSVIFMLALENRKKENTKKVFRELSFMAEELSFVQSLLKESNKEQFLLKLTRQMYFPS